MSLTWGCFQGYMLLVAVRESVSVVIMVSVASVSAMCGEGGAAT